MVSKARHEASVLLDGAVLGVHVCARVCARTCVSAGACVSTCVC